MERVLIALGTGGTAGAAAVDARAGVAAPARSVRRAGGAAAGGWSARRWWVLVLLALGWLVQAGLRVWLGRQQYMPLANPDETAYLVAARVLAGGPGADLSGSTLYQGGYPLLITPVYWFTHDPATVYHAVLVVNALISAAILPLGYLACRRLGLGRPAAYAVATVAALVPAGFFYSEYAMSDAVFPVATLAWLLATHTWLTATSLRGRCAAAAGSALLAGYSYLVHSRGLVMLAGFAAVAAFIAWRRPDSPSVRLAAMPLTSRLSVVVAGLTALVTVAAGWALNNRLSLAIYPDGTRSLSGQARHRLHTVTGIIHVLEMAAGQLWRLVLDSWGIAGLGLVAALFVIFRRGVRSDLRIMAALAVAVTAVIACTAPAALPADQPQAWASGRYLDGMIIVFFLAGAALLLRARFRHILACAGGSTALFVLAAVTVAIYAGSSVPTSGFGAAFNFAEPAVLTLNWTEASVPLATAVTVGLLVVWMGFAAVVRHWWQQRILVLASSVAFGACVGAVSLVAVAQMTSHVSQTGSSNAHAASAIIKAGHLRPGDQIAVVSSLDWALWVPQAFEVTWTELQLFRPSRHLLPAGANVVESPWPDGQDARAGWPEAPAGWRIVASDQTAGWVVWRQG